MVDTMNKSVNESIKAAKKIMDIALVDKIYEKSKFLEYSQFYFCTNEDIKSCLKQIDFHGKNNGLTVLSSGDHPFNLIAEGID